MKALIDAAHLLRKAAGDLDNLAKPPTIPLPPANLGEAFQRLRLACPTGYVSISPPAFDSHTPGKVEVREWQVYDGAKHYKGPTLHAALAACEAARGAADVDRVVEAVELLGADLPTAADLAAVDF